VVGAPRGSLHITRCTRMLLPHTLSILLQQQQQGDQGCLLCLRVWWDTPTPKWGPHTPGGRV
jgi:hypothetical protein